MKKNDIYYDHIKDDIVLITGVSPTIPYAFGFRIAVNVNSERPAFVREGYFTSCCTKIGEL